MTTGKSPESGTKSLFRFRAFDTTAVKGRKKSEKKQIGNHSGQLHCIAGGDIICLLFLYPEAGEGDEGGSQADGYGGPG